MRYITENGIIKSDRVVEAMKKVDRGNYVKHNPYVDSPQSIGYHVTISAPHMVGIDKFKLYQHLIFSFLLKLLKTLKMNFVQKCQIYVEKENLECHWSLVFS